jgi:hypothetical protein
MGVRDLATLERFTGGQLALVFARRCRAQGATDWNLRPPPSVVLRPQLAPTLGPFPLMQPVDYKEAASMATFFETSGQAKP